MRTWMLISAVILPLSGLLSAADAPKPYGAIPSERQLKWHELEYYGFIHFSLNTFTDKEWGDGTEKPSVFNPADFDANQIVGAAKAAGMKALILTCKHHDGFCLWPSKYTEHSVKNSPWKDGKGDVVKEISDSCLKHGLKFGAYLSPWDRNHKDYARPEYITYFRNQLTELMTLYGDISEVWFDGANGGTGYYGGANENRSIDKSTYYDWDNTWKIVRELQPDACMFSDVGPEIRWVGNESGYALDPCWSTITYPLIDGKPAGPGSSVPHDLLGHGSRGGKNWVPAEVDVSIRPGWFYHANQDNKVRQPDNLLKLYYQSVGLGGSLLLNIPPDRRGRIHENDVKSLTEFNRLLTETFKVNLGKDAKITAGNVRGESRKFAAKKVLDGDRETYWATDDSVTTPELILEMKSPVTFNVVDIREYLPLGQRVDEWAIDIWLDGAWAEMAKGTAIGARRLVRGGVVTTDKVRFRITKSPVCPAISEFGLYLEPEEARKASGVKPVVVTMRKKDWKVVSASYQVDGNSKNAIDGDVKTLWHTHGSDGEHKPPHDIVIDLGKQKTIKGFVYVPRSDGTSKGIVNQFEFFASLDGVEWGQPVSKGEFANIKANPIPQDIKIAAPVSARFIKFRPLHSVDGDHVTTAELDIVE